MTSRSHFPTSTTELPRPDYPSPHPLILTRLYHRWLPYLATEPTSTLLLISPLNRFIDLRISRTTPPTLLHATAGTYIRTLTSGLRGFVIDSLSPRSENHYHSLFLQANGDILESGEWLSSEEKTRTEYECVWRVSVVLPRVCVVLVLRKTAEGREGARGMVMRVGGWCQGVLKTGAETTAERWVRGADGKWSRVFRVGKELLPCGVACLDRDESDGAAAWQGGRYWKEAKGLGFVVEKIVTEADRVEIGRWGWEVVERCHW